MSATAVAGLVATVRNVELRGVVSAVPSTVVGNAHFEQRFGKDEVANVVKMIGVEQRRRVKPGQTTVDLAVHAARALMADVGWNAQDIGLVMLVTQTPDYALPSSACVVHGILGLGPSCASFDVNLGCSGYVYALWLAGQLMQSGSIGRALVLVGDTAYYADEKDRSTALLFGDAVSATALEWTPGAPAWQFVLGSDGSGARNLVVPKSGTRQEVPTDERMAGRDPEKLFMDGGEIFNFTLRAVPMLGDALFAAARGSPEDFDAYLFHQANAFMLKHLIKKMRLPVDRVPLNISRYGNTSSASIPLLMSDDLAERLLSAPARLAMFGFGVGYSWGAADIRCGPLASARVVEL